MNKIFPNLDYSFKDKQLIELALTHKSYSGTNNERLEFLGDAILNLYVSERLFNSYESSNEGKLTRYKASIVSRDNLNLVAQNLNIGGSIKLGKGEKLDGNSILGNTLEAVIGAIFIDSDYDVTTQILGNLFQDNFLELEEEGELKDPKSSLQELIQKHYKSLPRYSSQENTSKNNLLRFAVTCSVDEANLISEGTGSTRKKAESQAASEMLELLKNNDP